ncbi:hypothetical protein [Cytobacillus kochii]|uniref:hypothetical protein n=1 Tax=Cytobacillus kochii TaxID=859143 RepID=UPI00402AB672
MGYNNQNYSDSYGYDHNDCGCDEFFRNISRGEDVKVFLKGGGHVFGEFIDVRGNLVFLAKANCNRHDDHHDDRHKDCCDKKDRVRITTICCDDIIAVETR